MKTHAQFGLILALVAVASIPAAAQTPGRTLSPPIRPRGVLTHVPSTAGGQEGIAVRIVPPQRPRYEAGAPVAISVAGGHHAGNATSRMNVAGCGFVEVSFAFPSGGRGDATSGGTYDYRGPKCIQALRDVILFAMGKTADKQGRKMQDLLGDVRVLTSNVGLHGGSHGGNACGAVMGLHGRDFPELAWYVSMESPYGEGAVGAELGARGGRVCPAYHPETGVLDLTQLAFDPNLEIRPFGAGRSGDPLLPALRGSLFFDMDGDGKCESEDDYRLQPPVFDVGQGRKSWYSVRLIREAEKRGLFGDPRAAHIPTLEEAVAFWRYRDATGLVADAVRKVPNLAVIVVAGETDHVQVAPDHPHIRAQVNAFQEAGAKLIRLNPDRAYVEWLLDRKVPDAPDNDAGLRYTPKTIKAALCPDGAIPKQLLSPAAMCELADRVQANNWTENLASVLYSRAPRVRPGRSPAATRPRRDGSGRPRPVRPFPGVEPRPQPPRRPVQPQPRQGAQPPFTTPYGNGTKQLEVDCAKTVGKIRSLLGTNRGPLSFPRRPGERPVSHVESFRTLGIDFIRTHDFYGPTDWHVIFPDWSVDPGDPAGYDFRSSDERIRAIADNGFRCFYRLGTSWKGRQTRPINDPPGTIRDADGRVVHRADRDDARKWAKICVRTMRHYTEGWHDGYRFPIQYWEIWNEPDLAAQFWTGTPEQYYIFYEEAAKALKAANAKLKVGGPACTGGLRRQYVEGFVRYCRDHDVPLDFFSWHSYGGRGRFNPYQYYRDAMRVRKTLDEHGFKQAENINTEWNAGIQHRLFSDTPAGAAFYASTLACMLDAGVDYAFQYCGDRHPGLGLHGLSDGKPKICAYSFLAWKRMLDAPNRVAATGSDKEGYNIVAGKDADGRRVRILISDFQSGHDAFRLEISNLPWDDAAPFTLRRSLLDAEHRRLDIVEQFAGKGRALTLERPFVSGSVCLLEISSN